MLKFYKCDKCNNIVELIRNGGGKLVCCEEEMKELVANTSDASKEKHVPVIELVDGKIRASVGSATHPMEEKHYIEWIAFVKENTVKRVMLKPGETPEACFKNNGGCEVYAYCNLHGLWKVSFSERV